VVLDPARGDLSDHCAEVLEGLACLGQDDALNCAGGGFARRRVAVEQRLGGTALDDVIGDLVCLPLVRIPDLAHATP